MKHAYTFLALLLLPLLVMAQPVGNLTIFSESGDRFYLVLNGERQNDAPQTNVRIEGLAQPYYSAQIIFQDKRLPDITKNVQVTDMNGTFMDVTYKLRREKSAMSFNYSSMAAVPERYNAPRNMWVRHYRGHNKDGKGDWGRDGDHRRRQELYPMNDNDFAQAKAAVRNATFNSDMLTTAQGILRGNYLTTAQVMDMCGLFSFDDSKMQFAKEAYFKTLDPENYFRVVDMFSFSSSKTELNNFIASNQNAANNNNNNNGRGHRSDRYEPMDGFSFEQAKQTIKKASFDDTKVSSARVILSSNYFTADQVVELCKLLSFDDSKLTVAKEAYARTLDRNNYFKVSSVFSFSSSKEKLSQFINTQN